MARPTHPKRCWALLLNIQEPPKIRRIVLDEHGISAAPRGKGLSLETVMDTAAFAARSTNNRSKVSNGSRLHQKGEADGRSVGARRFRDLCAGFAAPYGGATALTVAEQALIRNAASLTLQLEQMQADVAAGRPVDSEQLTRLANSAARTLASLRKGREYQTRGSAPTVVNPAVQHAPARAPTIAEVAAEQARRAVAPAVDAATPMSGPGPDLSELGDDELERLKVYLREVGGDADA